MRKNSDFESIEVALYKLRDRNPDISVNVAPDESDIRIKIASQKTEVTLCFNPAGLLYDVYVYDYNN